MTAFSLSHGLGWHELSSLFGHFLLLSMLAVGGAITTTPEMHRYLVDQQGWMDDSQFTASIALAQAAPGPNLLFVAVLGWGVGGVLGMVATMIGILVPSTTVALAAARWGRARRETRGVRAFTQGLAPITVGLLLSTGWVLATPVRHHPAALALVVGTVAMMLRTRISPMWLIGAGAALGAAVL